MRTKGDLRQMQSVPLAGKIIMTQRRIREWYEAWNGQVYVSFSGGKDSTVLLHLVREMYPDVEAVFVNTGLEYPEIQKFVKTFDNVTILRPKMRFDEVINKYGYPLLSKAISRKVSDAKKGKQWAMKFFDGTATKADGEKSFYCVEKYAPLLECDFNCSDQCCFIMKKSPAKLFAKKSGKKPMTAQMASESCMRLAQWMAKGCNAFDTSAPISNPMSFWTEQDVLRYIKQNGIQIASVYGDIVELDEDGLEYENNLFGTASGQLKTTALDRTGCIFCAFGCHLEKGESRFERLKKTHPRQYAYCIGGGEYDEEGIWKPNKEGLGMGHVFDELNKIYGDGFIRY
jgi:3'-phosphoadenosine 5'-phosphosulfate sulfotransferase (PAPS reductase)/FAD synthetase